jgi:uracil-DNA glycosylase family 4
MQPRSAEERRAELVELFREAEVCARCPLSKSRTKVVFGAGNADADLMFVGEAPGMHEDQQGLPFVGRAGQLLNSLLEEIGLSREDVFIANVLQSRPPGNRDPQPDEIDACKPFLHRKIELIEPKVVCTLGNFSTKLLRGDPTGISRLHGQAEIITIGNRAVRLYPLFHPAAALYTRSLLETLRADFERLPALLALDPPVQPEPVVAPVAAAIPDPRAAAGPEEPPAAIEHPPDGDFAGEAGQATPEPEPEQLGLF